MIIEILSQDLGLANEPAQFHLFHKWSKWYRVEINPVGTIHSFWTYIEQHRHCLLCHKMQKSEIKKIQCL